MKKLISEERLLSFDPSEPSLLVEPASDPIQLATHTRTPDPEYSPAAPGGALSSSADSDSAEKPRIRPPKDTVTHLMTKPFASEDEAGVEDQKRAAREQMLKPLEVQAN